MKDWGPSMIDSATPYTANVWDDTFATHRALLRQCIVAAYSTMRSSSQRQRLHAEADESLRMLPSRLQSNILTSGSSPLQGCKNVAELCLRAGRDEETSVSVSHRDERAGSDLDGCPPSRDVQDDTVIAQVFRASKEEADVWVGQGQVELLVFA